MSAIRIEGVTKMFAGDVTAVHEVTLTIGDGEFLVLVGPSGCGKTTLLRMLAGLEDVSAGSIHIGEREVTNVPARDRDIAMVFQNYALYPHMNVYENLAFCLKMQRMPKAEIRSRVQEVARMLGLKELLERRPGALSGGQRQRVAMGRAIVREPEAFLMDEPLSNLDAKLRVGMRTELARLHERLSTTTVYVTHDQIEAMTLGQRVAVMHDGHILQVDTPQVIYARPENLFVAAFIGSPSMNLVEATVDGDTVEFGGFRFPIARDRRPSTLGETVILGIRPEAFEDAAFAERGLPQVEVEVDVLEELGSDTHIVFPVKAPRVDLAEIREATEDNQETLFEDEQTSLFNARVDPRTAARAGGRVRLAVDPSAFHFFDPDSRARLADSAALTAA